MGVLMEGFSQFCLVLENQSFNLPQVMWWNAAVAGQCDSGIESEFALAIWSSDMDVGRFISLIRIKVKLECPDSQYRWHVCKFTIQGRRGNGFISFTSDGS